jgi:hypothetical protein
MILEYWSRLVCLHDLFVHDALHKDFLVNNVKLFQQTVFIDHPLNVWN